MVSTSSLGNLHPFCFPDFQLVAESDFSKLEPHMHRWCSLHLLLWLSVYLFGKASNFKFLPYLTILQSINTSTTLHWFEICHLCSYYRTTAADLTEDPIFPNIQKVRFHKTWAVFLSSYVERDSNDSVTLISNRFYISQHIWMF